MRRAVDYTAAVEAKLYAEGLMPVRSQNTIALGYSGKVPHEAWALAIRSTRPGVEAALTALGHTWKLGNTRPIGKHGAPEVWVTPNAHADLRVVQKAQPLLAGVRHSSLPTAARRLALVPATFRSFAVALALEAPPAALEAILASVPDRHCVTCTCSPDATPSGAKAKTGRR